MGLFYNKKGKREKGHIALSLCMDENLSPILFADMGSRYVEWFSPLDIMSKMTYIMVE